MSSYIQMIGKMRSLAYMKGSSTFLACCNSFCMSFKMHESPKRSLERASSNGTYAPMLLKEASVVTDSVDVIKLLRNRLCESSRPLTQFYLRKVYSHCLSSVHNAVYEFIYYTIINIC
jgi:hypothetical protein